MGNLVISDEVMSVLRRCRVEGSCIYLPEQLERDLYVKTNKVLEALGAKWQRKAKAHVFDYDLPDVIRRLNQVVETGIAPEKNPLGFFPTPSEVAYAMIDIAIAECVCPVERILEPSAGTGAIVACLVKEYPGVPIDMVERDELRCKMLSSQYAQYGQVYQADYINWSFRRFYSLIVMNPPFTVLPEFSCDGKGNLEYIHHLARATQSLMPGGVVVSVVPGGFTFRKDKIVSDLREVIDLNGGWMALPDKAFEQSGTDVRCSLVWYREPWGNMPVEAPRQRISQPVSGNQLSFLGE